MAEKDLIVEFKDILQKGITHIKNIEIMTDERNAKLKEVRDSLDRINENLEKRLSHITQNSLTNITMFINNFFNDVKPKCEKLSIAQTMITDTVKQLNSDIKVFSIKALMKKIDDLEKIDFSQPIIPQVVEESALKPKSTIHKKTIFASPTPTATTPISATQPQTNVQAASIKEISDNTELLESEVEGTKIYDSIITGWKRRDWEKLGGTREMFIKGWTKLSSFDRQKIKNGTWSKPMMNKVKMLGRARKG
ncbi:MAG: hypothetical protein ACTSRG_04110 [Candidatus Helarchaeota archaeon]